MKHKIFRLVSDKANLGHMPTSNLKESLGNDGSDNQRPHLDQELEKEPESKQGSDGNDRMDGWEDG